jgi:8-oxo-dGTP pyrophosphatase MutT (NUDIX family)
VTVTSRSGLVHEWRRDDRAITFSWIGEEDVKSSRVYAFAFSGDGKMLLVTDSSHAPKYWLPGGGIEEGETPEEALARELVEEAGATIRAARKIGTQRVDDPLRGTEFHIFYWCRITLVGEFLPRYEIQARRLVVPDEFLDALFWGRSDPKAPMLLDKSLDFERQYVSDPGAL